MCMIAAKMSRPGCIDLPPTATAMAASLVPCCMVVSVSWTAGLLCSVELAGASAL